MAVESPRWLSDLEQEAWRNWLEVMRRLPIALEARLQTRSGLTITDYQVLAELSEAPDRRMRMTRLAYRTCLSKSRLSHQIKRMESAGLIGRAECPEDRRGSFAVLTQHGLDALVAAAPEHVEDVRELFVDLLPPQDLAGFARSLGIVAVELELRARKEREEHEQELKASRRESREARESVEPPVNAEDRSRGDGGSGGGDHERRGSDTRHGRPNRAPARR